MTGSEDTKSSSAKTAGETGVGLVLGIVLTIALYEVGSRLDIADHTVALYERTKCQLLLANAESRRDSLDQRIKDVEAEQWELAEESGAIDVRVQHLLTVVASHSEELPRLAEAIQERERIMARADALLRLQSRLTSSRDATQRNCRDLKVQLARHEADLCTR